MTIRKNTLNSIRALVFAAAAGTAGTCLAQMSSFQMQAEAEARAAAHGIASTINQSAAINAAIANSMMAAPSLGHGESVFGFSMGAAGLLTNSGLYDSRETAANLYLMTNRNGYIFTVTSSASQNFFRGAWGVSVKF